MAITLRRVRALAFTLVELLVTIAIIAILASLLLPALAHAKNRGQGAVCKSNLRQLGLAVNAYTLDHSKFPPRYFVHQQPPKGIAFWFDYLEAYTVSRYPSNGIYRCPSYKSLNADGTADFLGTTMHGSSSKGFRWYGPAGSYGYNGLGSSWNYEKNDHQGLGFVGYASAIDGGSDDIQGTIVDIAAVKMPTEMYSFADSRVTREGASGNWFGNYEMSYRLLTGYEEKKESPHGKNYTTAFVDGHVEAVPRKRMFDTLILNRHWNRDFEPYRAE